MAENRQRAQSLEVGIRLVLEELRDLRVAMREDRRRADEDRRQAGEDRRRADEARKRSDARFERLIDTLREGSTRRDAAIQRTFRDLRTVGLSIVKTLNRHTRILERIDHKLSAPRNGRPPGSNGGTAKQ